ncbi:DUF294 nucleotidyltransferase-like domain-containing protein [Bacillus massiliigorillae]|uniref:DUF294 nucleotidyltransferase-like domain-containing protein n=1 Tax=Bacillus massiliigorillae TaxID=1243664 RepID=UPI00039A8AB1|nr:DUF294 nucleotidyltransferase-like domain-containing protein [Bacillus massiliigorillae]
MGGEKQDVITAVRFHPFFQGAEPMVISLLLEMCEERHFTAGDVILHARERRTGLFLVIDGIAEVYVMDEQHGRNEVLEIIAKEEMIGFSSLADFLGAIEQTDDVKAEELVEVRAVEDIRALYIPFEVVTKRWTDPIVHDYFLTQVAIRLRDVYSSLAEQVRLARDMGESDSLVLRVQDIMSPITVTCSPEESVQNVARKMIDNRISSVLIMEGEQIAGIVTERDIVERIVVQNRTYQELAKNIMTENPITISRFSYYYDALSTMVLKGVKRLPVEDNGIVCGMLTLSDLMRKKNESMLKTIRSIEEADVQSLPQVKGAIYKVFETLLKEQVPMVNVLAVVTTLFDRLIKRAVNLALQDIQDNTGLTPPVTFNLYTMGSGGRGEQFMLTDQDHFLVFENSDDEEEVHSYFKLLGEKIVHYLELAGYARCKGLMMSSEATWRGTLDEWRIRLKEWGIQSSNEQLLLAINFFSYRMVYGDENLHHKFEDIIDETLQRYHLFLFRLAQIEQERPMTLLGQPIRSLFRLEKKCIDMKKDILFPYHHGLQILSMVHGVLSGTPFERIDALEQQGVFSHNFAHDLREAVNQVLTLYVQLRWKQAKKNGGSSSILYFTTLTTREKEELIISVKTLKELQNKLFYQFSMQI